MIFPLHSSVITPTFRSHPGLADGEVTSQQQAKILEKDVKEVAIRAAAASMALQIGLMFVPVVGWALGALISLVQYFTSKHYEGKVKSVLASTKKAIEAKANAADMQVKAVASAIYDQEYRGAVALAMSDVPLEGMGDFWSDAKDTTVKTFKKVAPVVRKISMAPVTLVVAGSRAVTSVGLKALAEGSKAVGADGFARDVREFEEKGDKIAKDIQYRTEDPKRAHELMSGKEMSNVAESRANDLKNTAFKEIDRVTADAVAKLQSPEGRLALRMETAKALRGDPETLAAAFRVDQEQQMLKAQLAAENTAANAAIASMVPTAQTTQNVSQINKTTALVGTGLAAVAAFLAFR